MLRSALDMLLLVMEFVFVVRLFNHAVSDSDVLVTEEQTDFFQSFAYVIS